MRIGYWHKVFVPIHIICHAGSGPLQLLLGYTFHRGALFRASDAEDCTGILVLRIRDDTFDILCCRTRTVDRFRDAVERRGAQVLGT